jgi:hypothetical protein
VRREQIAAARRDGWKSEEMKDSWRAVLARGQDGGMEQSDLEAEKVREQSHPVSRK